MGCIYRITNAVNGWQYIGQTRHDWLTARWNGHVNALRGGRHRSSIMNADFVAFGEESFTIEIIEHVSDPSMLNDREWRLAAAAIADGISLYNVQQPKTCEACGRNFFGKPGSPDRCVWPTSCGWMKIHQQRQQQLALDVSGR